MADKYGYGWEKFLASMNALTGEGTLKFRMKYAILALHTLSPGQHLPPYMQKRFQILMKKMTSVSSDNPKVGSVESTVESMRDIDLTERAREIVSMYDELCRYKEPIGE